MQQSLKSLDPVIKSRLVYGCLCICNMKFIYSNETNVSRIIWSPLSVEKWLKFIHKGILTNKNQITLCLWQGLQKRYIYFLLSHRGYVSWLLFKNITGRAITYFREVFMGWKHISTLHQISIPSKDSVGEWINGENYLMKTFMESLTEVISRPPSDYVDVEN